MHKYSLLAFTSLVSVLACTPPPQAQKLNWPDVVEECAPTKTELLDTVSEVLLSDGDASLSDRAFTLLEKLAYQETPEAVVCAVNNLHVQWTSVSSKTSALSSGEPVPDATTSNQAAAKRGAEFLDRVGTKR